MCLTNEHVGPKILAKIKIYVLTRAELLIPLCYEIPCILESFNLSGNLPDSKILFIINVSGLTKAAADLVIILVGILSNPEEHLG